MNPTTSTPGARAHRRPASPSSRKSGILRSSSARLAAALLGLAGLASSAYADATWTGGTSPDWNTIANWSSTPSTPAGNFFINTATGNFPVLSAAPAFGPVDLFIGNGAGNTGRLDQTTGSLALANTSTNGNWCFVGANTGTGTYNLTGDASLTVGKLWVGGFVYGENGNGTLTINTTGAVTANSTDDFSGWGQYPLSVSIGWGTYPSGTGTGILNLVNGTLNANGLGMFVGAWGSHGTVNQTGGIINTADLTIVRWFGNGVVTVANGAINTTGGVRLSNSGNGGDTANAILNVNAGGIVSTGGDVVVAVGGNNASTGAVTVATGGTLNVGNTVKRALIVNQYDLIRGDLTVSGTINLNANTDLLFSGSNGTGPGTVTLNAGTIAAWSGFQTGGPATSVLDLNRGGGGTAVNTFNLNGGTLAIGQIISTITTGTRVFNFNGGTLKASASNAAFFAATAASAANVLASGALIDSNGFDLTIAKALTGSTGGLTKLGAGTLTLSGVNTYSGNTTVSAGALALADNASLKFVVGAAGVNTKITGTGAFNAAGDFDIDVTGAGTTFGTSWQLVDIAALTETFGATFSVTGFTANGANWVKPANGTFYEFSPATGLLRVIADPGIAYSPPTVTLGAYSASYVIGSDVTLGVSATGTGTLTYQWYYKATAGATAVAISGATSASYTIPAATAGATGIYSVTVSDHAAEASGQPATTTTTAFPSISVLPGTSFAVAYYRFEEGTNAAAITSATDSVGTNALSALGAPLYSSASLPYTSIPRTGAANTLGANFPATGNQGLVAPTGDTLANTQFTDFTIEAFVRPSSLDGWQTIVGRDDDANPGQGAGGQSLFYLSKAGGAVGTGVINGFRIELIDRNGSNLQVNSTFVPSVGTWYHVAAVGNASTGILTLYVNGTAVGSTPGFTGLFVPTTGSDTPWTVGRGDFAANDGDFFRGDIDEVRFTRAALPVTQLLNSNGGATVVNPAASISPAAQTIASGAPLTLTATGASNMGGTVSYQWYKDGTPLASQTSATLAVTATTSGSYSVLVTDSNSATLGFAITNTAASAIRVLTLPAAGRRSLALNFVGSGSGAWSTELGVLAANATAGFYSTTNWNNSAAITNVATQTTPLSLTESTGSNSYATATWSSADTWSARTGTGTVAAKTPNGILLHGYIESRDAAGASVTVSNIPYPSYDVYVYVAGGGNANVGSVSLNSAGNPTYYYRVLQHDSYAITPVPTVGTPYAPFAMIGDAADRAGALAAPAATFVRFTGVSGSALTITAKDQTLNANAGGIAAIQIVDTTSASTPYPPTITASPVSVLRAGGASASLSVSAVSNNSGGVLSYVWQKDGSPLSGQTAATLSLSGLSGAQTGTYTVLVTDTSGLGAASTSRSASLVVVDATRSLLINGDINTATSLTQVGNGILRPTGTDTTNLGSGTTTWNGVLGAAGAATRSLPLESTGLSIPGVTFSYAAADGVEDNTTAGSISTSPAVALSRDYLYTDSQSAPLTASIGGLEAFAGKKVTLLVYAYGKLSAAFFESVTSDTATVTLATANNHLSSVPTPTTTSDFGGRNIVDNNLDTTAGASAAYVTFEGVVAADGTVSWSLSPDTDGGRIPLVGFQLLITNENIAPPVPTGLAATLNGANVNLAWSASTGAATYTVKRATVSGGPYTTLSAGSLTGTSYTDSAATAATTYYYVVAAANALATSAHSTQASVTTASASSPLQTWRLGYFSSAANTGNGANTADPDADGLSNLVEYALGTNPTASNASPVVLGIATGQLTLTFSPVVDASLTYVIEASTDLTAAWTVVNTYPAFASTSPVTYTDAALLSANPRRFLRLKITAAE
ncbi:MAG: hypothetical protein RIQ79_700 [Verrucomicrobiota bacterium]